MYRTDDYIWKVRLYLMKRYGCDASEKMVYPLVWYISTGRSSAEFEKRLVEIKPFIIGRILAKDGTIDEAVNRVKARVWKGVSHA